MTIDRNDLTGAWRLHDYVLVDADGHQRRPFREGSTGLLFYTANGYMSVATMLIDDETGEAAFLSYHGPFDLYDDRVVHHIRDEQRRRTDRTRQRALPGAGWRDPDAHRQARSVRRRGNRSGYRMASRTAFLGGFTAPQQSVGAARRGFRWDT